LEVKQPCVKYYSTPHKTNGEGGNVQP